MGLPHITSFCYCMGLEVGSSLIAFLHLASSSTLTIICASIAESIRHNIGTVEDAEDKLYTNSYKLFCGITILSSFHILLALILVIGIFKRNTMMLRAWVVIMSILFVCALIYIVGVTIAFGMSASGSDIFLKFMEGLIFFGVLGYCILCVNSFYLFLKSSEDMEGPY